MNSFQSAGQGTYRIINVAKKNETNLHSKGEIRADLHEANDDFQQIRVVRSCRRLRLQRAISFRPILLLNDSRFS